MLVVYFKTLQQNLAISILLEANLVAIGTTFDSKKALIFCFIELHSYTYYILDITLIENKLMPLTSLLQYSILFHHPYSHSLPYLLQLIL